MRLTTAILPAIAIFASMACGAQTMYKCVQGGKTVYQGQPCPGSAKQHTIKDPDAPSAPSSPSAPPSAEVDRTVEFMSTYRACADAVTAWRAEMAAPYEAWRGRNSAMVARIEGDPQLRTLLQQRVDAKRKGKAAMCRPVGLELRGVKQ